MREIEPMPGDQAALCVVCGSALPTPNGGCPRCERAFQPVRAGRQSKSPADFDLREEVSALPSHQDLVGLAASTRPPGPLRRAAEFLFGSLSPLIIGFLIGWAVRSYYPAVPDAPTPGAPAPAVAAPEVRPGDARDLLVESPTPPDSGAPGLHMRDFKLLRNGAELQIRGAVRNRGERRYALVAATFKLFDKNGALLDEVRGTKTDLGPGETWMMIIPLTEQNAARAELVGLSGL